MKLKNVILTGVTALSFGMIVGTSQVSAKTYTTVPSSLRGNWYSYDYGIGYSKLHATKYTFISDNMALYGNKFPKYAMGHSQMFVYKNSKGYYNIGKYASDEWPYWKRVTHNGHAAIRQITYMLPGYITTYWYKSKSIAKHPRMHYTTVNYNGFYFDKYVPAYLQVGEGSQKLYTSSSNAQKKKGKYIKVNSIYRKYYAKWDNGEKNNVLRIRVNSKTYYMNANGAFQPYNSWREDGHIYSPYSPSSISKIVIRHGDKYTTARYWEKSKDYNLKGDIFITDSWKQKNGGWIKD